MLESLTPFGGCRYSIQLNQEDLMKVLTVMGNECHTGTHSHNIAVDFGYQRIYTSELGTECVKEILRED